MNWGDIVCAILSLFLIVLIVVAIYWLIASLVNGTSSEEITTDNNPDDLKVLLEKFTSSPEVQNLPYFLIRKSLKNPLPSDPIDIGLLNSSLDDLLKIDFSALGLQIERTTFGYRIINSNSAINIFILREKHGYIHYEKKNEYRVWGKITIPKTDVFPLKDQRIFGSLMHYPHNAEKYFDDENCSLPLRNKVNGPT